VQKVIKKCAKKGQKQPVDKSVDKCQNTPIFKDFRHPPRGWRMRMKKCCKYLIYKDFSSANETTKNSLIRQRFCLADELADDWRMRRMRIEKSMKSIGYKTSQVADDWRMTFGAVPSASSANP